MKVLEEKGMLKWHRVKTVFVTSEIVDKIHKVTPYPILNINRSIFFIKFSHSSKSYVNGSSANIKTINCPLVQILSKKKSNKKKILIFH